MHYNFEEKAVCGSISPIFTSKINDVDCQTCNNWYNGNMFAKRYISRFSETLAPLDLAECATCEEAIPADEAMLDDDDNFFCSLEHMSEFHLNRYDI